MLYNRSYNKVARDLTYKGPADWRQRPSIEQMKWRDSTEVDNTKAVHHRPKWMFQSHKTNIIEGEWDQHARGSHSWQRTADTCLSCLQERKGSSRTEFARFWKLHRWPNVLHKLYQLVVLQSSQREEKILDRDGWTSSIGGLPEWGAT